MKKLLSALLIISFSAAVSAQKAPPKPRHPRHAPPKPGELPPDAPRPLSPKEVWQKMHEGKRKADAKREKDMKEMGMTDPKPKRKKK